MAVLSRSMATSLSAVLFQLHTVPCWDHRTTQTDTHTIKRFLPLSLAPLTSVLCQSAKGHYFLTIYISPPLCFRRRLRPVVSCCRRGAGAWAPRSLSCWSCLSMPTCLLTCRPRSSIPLPLTHARSENSYFVFETLTSVLILYIFCVSVFVLVITSGDNWPPKPLIEDITTPYIKKHEVFIFIFTKNKVDWLAALPYCTDMSGNDLMSFG